MCLFVFKEGLGLKVNQVQLFEKGYKNRCSTYGCGERATKYVGRPDAPLNVSYVLCDKCVGELVQSIQEQYPAEASKADTSPKGVDMNGLTEAVEDARTHAEVDKIVKEYGLQGIQTKADGATVQARKDAILKTLE